VFAMMAELFGRKTGICGGKGGSMHLADFSVGMLGANGVVGGGFGIATGAALAFRLQGSDGVVVCFFGDSAINQGAFLENANYAALHRLPVIYLCENNQFAMSMPAARATALARLADRAAGIPMPGVTVDGMDVLAVRAVVAEAAARARAGDGPTLIVADCYRFEGHHVGDTEVYRTADDATPWRQRDPILALRRHLEGAGALASGAADAIDADVAGRVQAAVDAAERAPFPEPDDAFTHIHG
jgi:TPP-dependent pyruvate/acetoin dehydrogenase alpha subunit